MESSDFPPWSINLNGSQTDNDRFRWGSIWHVPQGSIFWRPERAKLFLTQEQCKGNVGLFGRVIADTIKTLPALNACALEYLLVRQEAIPIRWRAYTLHFWGTIYQESKGSEFVRCLFWNKDRWCEIDTLIDGYGWSRNSAAVLFEDVLSMASYYPERYTTSSKVSTVQRQRCA